MSKTTARRRHLANIAGDFRKGLRTLGRDGDHSPIPLGRAERAEPLASLARAFRSQLLTLGVTGPSPEPRSFVVEG